MMKACSKCGKIHPYGYKCNAGIIYKGGEERKLRQKNKWKEKSLEIRERQNHLCLVCLDRNEFPVGYAEEVHHIEKLSDRPDLLLDDEYLIGLCIRHHKEADNGKIEKDYLKELVKKRDETFI